MEMYLLKSGICLAILYGFYKLFLENESMHVFKRVYLLGAVGISFLIPLITFTTYLEIPETTVATTPVFVNTGNTSFTEIETAKNYWPFILWGLYALGVVFFSIKFGKNLKQLISKIKNNQKFTRDSIHHVLLKTPVIPHTFLNYVFLNKQKFEAREIPNEVIEQEHVHAKQKHSIDILLVELVQIVFWFNPLLYFIKGSIKLNHEFLADRAVLKQGVDTTAYQTLLLAFSSHAPTPTLANSINYSFIKKRFTVMKKQTSTQAIWLRSLIILPLVAILVFGFSSTEVIQKEAITEQTQSELQQEKATKAEIKEYNTLAKKYNTMSRDNMRIVSAEVDRMTVVYSKMTTQQKENAEPFPSLPDSPPAPPAPPAPDAPDAPKVAKNPPLP
ncbi:MAG: M56 family metallopeptidase, partial [Flavobacteriaceae bacterium]